VVSREELLALVRSERVMPIIRSDDRDTAVVIGRTLTAAGFRVLEVSLTTPDALDVIAELTESTSAEVGAGTVLTAQDAAAVHAAGASFVVTPAVTESIAASVELGLPVLAGALTPTEILSARDAGACAVKLFPAELGGPAYLAALRAPFPGIPLIPVGGVTLANGREYLARGAFALGVGSPLTGPASDPLDAAALARRAESFRRMASDS
jgi:2-dehydro-3-deoxyphosphogluconate aldolase/(4S)-4-hydroxy-2-oxoglutarate aldolase